MAPRVMDSCTFGLWVSVPTDLFLQGFEGLTEVLDPRCPHGHPRDRQPPSLPFRLLFDKLTSESSGLRCHSSTLLTRGAASPESTPRLTSQSSGAKGISELLCVNSRRTLLTPSLDYSLLPGSCLGLREVFKVRVRFGAKLRRELRNEGEKPL